MRSFVCLKIEYRMLAGCVVADADRERSQMKEERKLRQLPSSERKNARDRSEGDEPRVLLQFGRRSEDSFALDFAHPFSPLQAFAVALSALHSKMSLGLSVALD